MSFFHKIPMMNKTKHIFALGIGDSVVSLAALEACPEEESTGLSFEGDYWKLVESDTLPVQLGDHAGAVNELLLKHKRLGYKNAPIQMVLSSELISQVNVERPELPPAEIASSLQWSLRDLVPIAATDLLVDYFDPPIQPPGKNEIHVVAASREFVQPIVAILSEFNFKIKGIVHSDLVFGSWPASNRRLMMVTQLPRERAQLHIIANGHWFVSRRLRYTYDPYTLDLEDTKLIEGFALELQRLLDFFSGPMRQDPVNEIELLFENDQKEELCKAISEQLGMKVTVSAYPEWAQQSAKADYSNLLAIGGLQWFMGKNTPPKHAHEAAPAAGKATA